MLTSFLKEASEKIVLSTHSSWKGINISLETSNKWNLAKTSPRNILNKKLDRSRSTTQELHESAQCKRIIHSHKCDTRELRVTGWIPRCFLPYFWLFASENFESYSSLTYEKAMRALRYHSTINICSSYVFFSPAKVLLPLLLEQQQRIKRSVMNDWIQVTEVRRYKDCCSTLYP